MRRYLVFAMLLVATPAFADEREEIRELLRQADAAYDAGKIEEARRLQLEAWGIQKSYDIALNLAGIEYQRGDYVSAAEFARFAVSEYPPTSSDAPRKQLLDLQKKCLAMVGTLTVEAPEGATVTLDSEPLERLDGVYVEPGGHKLVAVLGDATTTKPFTVARGESVTVEVEFPVEGDNDVMPDPTPAMHKERTIAIAAGGALTLVSLGMHIGFRASSNKHDRDADRLLGDAQSEVGTGGCQPGDGGVCGELEGAIDKRNRAGRWSNVTMVTTGVLGAATIAAIVWPRRSTSTSLAPWVTTHGSGVTLRSRF